MKFVCKGCGKLNDTHDAADGTDAKPTDGDLLFCLYCAAGYVVSGDGAREITAAEEFEARMESPKEMAVVDLCRTKWQTRNAT